jgi:DNA-binding PadR family transcriptional regulator
MEGEMLKGHLDMIVLAVLSSGPAHGYAVIEEIKRRSGGAFDLPEGTVYPVLHRLEQAGLLAHVGCRRIPGDGGGSIP